MIPIGGFQEFSLQDYPGEIASIIFTQGCNWACPWCHNKSLWSKQVDPEKQSYFEQKVNEFMRQDKINHVVVTGGEPTIWGSKLVEFLEELKAANKKIKLDTNGSIPPVLRDIILHRTNLIDFIAMDIKANWNITEYTKASGIYFFDNNMGDITSSIHLIKRKSKVPYHFRVTLHPGITEEMLGNIYKDYSLTKEEVILQEYKEIK